MASHSEVKHTLSNLLEFTQKIFTDYLEYIDLYKL